MLPHMLTIWSQPSGYNLCMTSLNNKLIFVVDKMEVVVNMIAKNEYSRRMKVLLDQQFNQNMFVVLYA